MRMRLGEISGIVSMTRLQKRLATGAAQIALTVMATAPAAHAAGIAIAAADTADAAVEGVVVTGVRGSQPRTIADSPVPIDIISHAQLVETGKAGLKEILSSVIPSLALPAQNGGGTSASVKPFTVDGLSADYVLVLINGKRRHSTALINNLATVAGGSTPVDLDLIPPSAIDHIEFLRDGAAAQYGSDAITGVINIILKDGADGGEFDTMAGQGYQHTGALAQENADYGHAFYQGFIHFALSAEHHEPQPANARSTGILYPLVGGQPDPREATGNTNYGDSYGLSTLTNGVNLSYNLSTPVGNGLEAYSFSTVSYRDIKDARGAYRPDDLSSLPQIFPNGFQAYRLIHETDFQVVGGVKGEFAGWKWDASSTFGRDFNWLGAANTLNASLGPSVRQTSFFLGQQIFDQWTNTLDVTRAFDIGLAKPLDVSWGFEHRWEQFAQVAGEPNSYVNGGYVVPNDGTPFGALYHGQSPTAGLQSFTGTTPADAGAHSRNNYAAYLDLGTNLTEPWYVGLAARAEHYDDSSGNTLSGKLTTRYEILPGLALRGAVNNGFRAPSLAEEDFSTTQNTAVNIGGVQSLQQVKFLPVSNPLAKALGATPLTPERSVNVSTGVTFEPTPRLRATLDVYQIDISDRIVKSSAITGAAVTSILAPLGFSGLSSAQYFTNAVDTRTQGADLVTEYQQYLGDFGQVRWSAIYSLNETAITHIKANPAVLNGFGYVLFNAQARGQLTDSTPRDRIALGADWSLGKWHVHAVDTRYGAYTEPSTVQSLDAHFSPKWITDLDVSYAVTRNLTVSVGANNLFNIYPDRQSAAVVNSLATDTVLTSAPGYSLAAYGLPTNGNYVYGTNSPFGFGGFYYARVAVKF
jgi:iron complex outermembrane receptor protein